MDYALVDRSDDEDDLDNAGGTKDFSSDDDFGGKNGGNDRSTVISDDDSPVKKPMPKRKLGPKPTAQKPTAKRTKVAMSDSDSSGNASKSVRIQ